MDNGAEIECLIRVGVGVGVGRGLDSCCCCCCGGGIGQWGGLGGNGESDLIVKLVATCIKIGLEDPW